ncbi:MAG TPA: noncanonical pyrimidine nucleotidase, YjjG family [Firmicutes bacterium]|nr:noncanonical pyrimidine nucleotidase, YjjG family [Bacillota bacterium]
MKYDVILFDADETLYDFKKSEREAFKNTMIQFNFDYDETYHLNTYQDINTLIWKEFEQGVITQEKLKIERFKRLSDALNVSFNETDFANAYMEHLANASFLYDGSLELVKHLNQSHKLAIVTNGLTTVQTKRIRQSDIAKYFETVVISEEILISKPNPLIFDHTLNLLNVLDKSKVLMVGDSLTSDIQGGINFGIDTCWYNPEQVENHTDIEPTYEINSFEDLIALLETK